ncbi:MAG: ATP-binding cassette domain-containing protein [Butyrivibrio sp.]|nr:ATP-binding cassette domain-containing protein [Butyrivibrio sp.]
MRLIVRNLCKKYDEVTIIGNASYTFEQGSVYAVLGAAKSGKTTFLDCIGREATPDSGEIRLYGATGEKTADYADFGFVTKEPLLMEYMTGREYVRYCLRLHGSGEEMIDKYFEMLGMGEDTLDMLIREYTDGEKQALQMIVTMAVNSPVILMDEPFASSNKKAVKRFIDSMTAEHIIIMTADSLESVREASDEILTINHGAVEGFTADALDDDDIRKHIEEITTESGEETDA